MRVLLINGSPRCENSNTLKISDAFIKGLMHDRNKHEIETVTIGSRNIHPCSGCFACWYATPGVCSIKDDMQSILELYNQSDLVIWSFPLYYFGMPSGVKAFMDRLMPNNLPSFERKENGAIRHPQRNSNRKKHILISTCGFHLISSNYEALEKQFELFCGNDFVEILCPEGGVLGADELCRPIREYLSAVEHAGREFDVSGVISAETKQSLSKAIFEPVMYMKAVNLLLEPIPDEAIPVNPLNQEVFHLMQRMASTFTPDTAGSTPIVIELCFTDIGNTYLISVRDGLCQLSVSESGPYTTRIEIPFIAWKDIIDRKISITQSFIDRNYIIRGDFNTILRFDDLFPVIP